MSARYRQGPLLVGAIITLLAALWGGLLRMGWAWPVIAPVWARDHGPLLVCGFLGTVISLERVVALRQPWLYVAPLGTALGALAIIAGVPGWPGPALLTVGSAGFLVTAGLLLRRQATLFHGLLLLGAACWLGGNLRWLAGAAVPQVVSWWIGFLVLTIAGERLELSRLLRFSRWRATSFLLALGPLLGGIALTVRWLDAGVRLCGLGLLGLALWLGRYDLARRTVRKAGLTRFIAVALLVGYGWLGVGGVLALVYGGVTAGVTYDAILHAVMIGFTMGMILAHAPIIFPALLQVALRYTPTLSLPLALLHLSLVVRLTGDLLLWVTVRQIGGLLNAVALLLFLGNTARLAWQGAQGAGNPPAP